MDTMTQNTLADLRSMEHATDDTKDRYLLGICTLFVATIEDAKDRISQLELVFCSQLFPAFQNKLLESRHALHESENLHKQALQEWQTIREELLREIQELRADRESQILHLRQEMQGFLNEVQARTEEASQCKLELQEQSKFQKLEVEELQQELSRLRRELNLLELQQLGTNSLSEDQLKLIRVGLPGNEQEASIQRKLGKLSEEAAELRQENSKLLEENHYIHQKSSQISAELRSLKSKMLSETPSSDAKSLQLKLEQKSQERSLECFRRQLLSAEVEKERKTTHAALVKLHSLKKRYQSLRKQYTVLFRHSHLLDLQKQASISKKQVEPGFDAVVDERYLNTNVDGLSIKCNCPSTSKATKSAASQLHEDTPSKCLHAAAVSADNCAGQTSKGAGLQMVDSVASFDSKSPNTIFQKNSEGPPQHADCDQESGCDSRRHADKASQIGLCSKSSLKVADHANCDENDEKTEEGLEDVLSLKVASPEDGNTADERTKDNLQDSPRSLEALNSLEHVQRKIIEGANVCRSNKKGWLPVQKRASTSKHHPKAYKSLKTTWRNTRSRAEINGFDPHDDFLDTPQGNAFKSHFGNAIHVKHEADAVHGDEAVTSTSENEVILASGQEHEKLEGKNISFSQVTTQAPDPEADFPFHVNQSTEKSNEQTGSKQDGVQNLGSDKNKKFLTSVTSKAKGLPAAKQGPMYKFVEPVRRKDEREKLQGIECNQCKKFYDAVLSKDAPGAVLGRCEHRDAVSRHRYRYVPPSTPEGFWNIGFDSEM